MVVLTIKQSLSQLMTHFKTNTWTILGRLVNTRDNAMLKQFSDSRESNKRSSNAMHNTFKKNTAS